jgi:protein-tyrosine phosphatase
MIDIHSHILPFLDDGSDSTDTSLFLAKNYVDIGVSKVICTPHFELFPARMKSGNDFLNTFNSFKEELEKNDIPLQLYFGTEIDYTREILELAKKHELITINNTEYLLLEFYHMNVDLEIEEIIYSLGLYGYKVIIAHLERYHSLKVKLVQKLKKLGVLIQINAHSLFKKKYSKKILKLIKYDCVDFIASDIHSFKSNYMLDAYSMIKAKFPDKVEDLFRNNAEKYLFAESK